MCQKGSCTCSKGNKCPVAYPTYPGSVAGTNGWSPAFSVVPDGSTREVLRLIGWFGGTGTAPTDYIGQYVSSTGFTTVLADGENIKGAAGTVDNTAWTQILASDMTFGTTFPPIHTVDTTSTGTFSITAINSGLIAYKQLGKTMFLSFNFGGTATIANAIEAQDLIFYIKIPNSKVATGAPGTGHASLIPRSHRGGRATCGRQGQYSDRLHVPTMRPPSPPPRAQFYPL